MVSLSTKSKIKEEDYIKFIFYSKEFNYQNSKSYFESKIRQMSNDIGEPWNRLGKRAYVKHDFRMSSATHAQKKLDEKFNKDTFNYNRKYGNNDNNNNINYNNENNHVWNGINSNIRNQQPEPPKRKKLENLSFLDKLDDKSGAVLMVKDPNNENGDTFQCKFGKIDFSKNGKNGNSIEVLFDPTAPVFKNLNWKKEFMESFEKWQYERNDDFNPRFEFLLDTELQIIEPTKPTSYLLVYPSEFLGDMSGNQFDLRKKMVHTLEAINYLHRNDQWFTPIDVNQMYSISRNKTKTPENAQKQWQRWRNTQLGRKYNEMSEQEQFHYRSLYYYKYLFSSTIIMRFKNEQMGMPEYLNFQWYDCKIVKLDYSRNDIEKRIDEFHDCYNCGSAECGFKSCKEFQIMIDSYMKAYNDEYHDAKRKIGHFCVKCGESGGHYGHKCENDMACKFCGSSQHNNWKTWKCAY